MRWSGHGPLEQAFVESGQLRPAAQAQDARGGDHRAAAWHGCHERGVFQASRPRQLALYEPRIEREVVRHELGAGAGILQERVQDLLQGLALFTRHLLRDAVDGGRRLWNDHAWLGPHDAGLLAVLVGYDPADGHQARRLVRGHAVGVVIC